MKKTITALFALAGAAMAADTIDAKWTTVPNWNGSNHYPGNMAFEFTLTEDYSIEKSGAILGAYWGTKPTEDNGAFAFYLTEADGALTLNVGIGKLSDTNLNSDTTFIQMKGGVLSLAIEAGATYTMSTFAYGAQISWYYIYKDGTKLDQNITAFDYTMSGDTATPIAYGVNKGTTDNIPEPGTATLSLLALAGMAARRRRK